jgi:glycine/D-amino acid oxidase-like deaminating enzyme
VSPLSAFLSLRELAAIALGWHGSSGVRTTRYGELLVRRVLTDATPLTDDYSEEPFWWRAAPSGVSDATGDLPRTVDVAVIGAGYTGVTASRALAIRGRTVVVLERGELGQGASSRNGGQVHPGVKLSLPTLLHKYGPLGVSLYRETVAAFELVERLIADDQIECDYRRSGHIVLAHKSRHVKRLAALHQLYSDELQISTRLLSAEDLRDEIGSSVYHGGLLEGLSGGLQPAKYYAGLLRGARRAGAELYSKTPVRRIRCLGPRDFVVDSERGSVRAGAVLVATDGYVDSVIPALQRRIVPIGSYMLATEPLPEAVAKSISPNGRSFIDTKNFLFYWRVLADNRVVFGGRTSFGRITPVAARDVLYRELVRIHPQTDGARVAAAWGGRVGFTSDRLPHFGCHDGVAYAMGYCGSGVALSTYFGTRAGAWLAGGDPSGFIKLPFRPVPLYRGNPWFLPAVGWYYGLRDRVP